jgi:CHRD domain/PEP-CTERM motif
MLLFARFTLAAVIVLAGARTSDSATIFLANLTTSQEPGNIVPTFDGTSVPRPTPFGTATFVLNDAQTELSFLATIFNIDVTGSQTPDILNDNLTAAHIHASSNPAFTPPATAGVVWGFFGTPFNNTSPNEGVFTPFSSGVGGTFSGTWDASEGQNTTLTAQLPNILAGRAYINFHTVQFGGGEIRGAITAVPEPSTIMLVGGGLAAAVRARRRRNRQVFH